MALLRCINNRIALVVKARIVIYEVGERHHESHVLEIPVESPEEKKQREDASNDDDGEVYFTCANFSPCSSKFLAVSRNKDLLVWRRTDGGFWELTLRKFLWYSVARKLTAGVLRRRLARKCVQLRVLRSCDKVLVADRAGDVYAVRFDDTPPELLLGRLSMALDLAVDDEERHLIVCDRDEKIQVSRFPNCYHIAAFCLGHTQFVGGVALLRPDLLASGSGDGTVRLWRYAAGTELSRVSLSPPVKSPDADRPPAVRVLRSWPAYDTLACLVQGASQVLLFRAAEDDPPSLRPLQTIDAGSEPWDADFDEEGRLWILVPGNARQPVQLFVRQDDAESPYGRFDGGQPWSGLLEDAGRTVGALEEPEKRPGDTSHLYKRWFDNVREYLTKKGLREETEARRKKRQKLR